LYKGYLNLNFDTKDTTNKTEIDYDLGFLVLNETNKKYYNMCTSIILGEHDNMDDDDELFEVLHF
jgi:hypothetical protein